jgi:cytochrome c
MLTMMSAGDEQFDIIKLLAAAAVNLDHGNADYTTLSFAVEQGNALLVQALLDPAADPDVKAPNGGASLPNSGSDSGILKTLLDAGADPNVTNEYEETAVFTVIEYGSIDDLQALIDAGANLNHKAENGQSPVGRADSLRKLEMKELLERNGGTG